MFSKIIDYGAQAVATCKLTALLIGGVLGDELMNLILAGGLSVRAEINKLCSGRLCLAGNLQ